MRQVTVYITSDNKQFDDKDKAQEYQVLLDTVQELAQLLAVSVKTNRPESILKEMIEEAQGVKDILTKFQKRQPRKKKEMKLAA